MLFARNSRKQFSAALFVMMVSLACSHVRPISTTPSLEVSYVEPGDSPSVYVMRVSFDGWAEFKPLGLKPRTARLSDVATRRLRELLLSPHFVKAFAGAVDGGVPRAIGRDSAFYTLRYNGQTATVMLHELPPEFHRLFVELDPMFKQFRLYKSYLNVPMAVP